MAATRHQSHQGMSWITYLLAICAGGANPAQAGANAQLNKSLGSTVWAGIFIYLSGLLGMLLALAIFRQTFPASGKMAETPWWAWTGGLVSLGSTLAGLTFAQKMGSGLFTGLSVTAALITSIAFDHFGLIGFKVHPVSPMRLAGGILMILGLWLIAKF